MKICKKEQARLRGEKRQALRQKPVQHAGGNARRPAVGLELNEQGDTTGEEPHEVLRDPSI